MLKPCQGPTHVVPSPPAPPQPPACLPEPCLDPHGIPQAPMPPQTGKDHGAGALKPPRWPSPTHRPPFFQIAQSKACMELWPDPALSTEPWSWHHGISPSGKSCAKYWKPTLDILGTNTGPSSLDKSAFAELQAGAGEPKHCYFGGGIYIAALSDCWWVYYQPLIMLTPAAARS